MTIVLSLIACQVSSGATFVKIDRISNPRDNSPALLFQDDGGGMDPDRLRKCMSLGYSSKTSNSTIGQYGNGFKTSTMRLGADVIVFSRSSRSGYLLFPPLCLHISIYLSILKIGARSRISLLHLLDYIGYIVVVYIASLTYQ